MRTRITRAVLLGVVFVAAGCFSARTDATVSMTAPAYAQDVEDCSPATVKPDPVGPTAMRLEQLPYLKRAKMFQWSSFSHPSANDDNFYYPDPHAKGFDVFIDIKGPGSLNHWWSTGGMPAGVQLKFYFDNEQTPRLSTTIGEWCSRHGPLGKPNWPSINFVPMPFNENRAVYEWADAFGGDGQAIRSHQGQKSPLDGFR